MPDDPHMLERAVLCHALRDPSGETRDRIFQGLHPFLFRDHGYRELYMVIAGLNSPIDEVGVAQSMGGLTLDAVGGLRGLYELTQTVPHSAHADQHAKLLRDANANDAYSEALDVCKLDLDDGHSIVHSFRHLKELESPQVSSNGHLSLQEAAQLAADDLLAIDDGSLAQLKTPFPSLDAILGGGLQPGLVVLAARPSVGKTALALALAHHYAKSISTAFISLEMSASQLAARVLQATHNLRKPTGPNFYTPDLREKLRAAPLSLQDSHLRIFDATHDLPSVLASLNTLRPRIAFIDYLQLIEAGSEDENRATQVGAISRALKALSLSLEIPVVALAQLNRQAEITGRAPKLSDLRESGSIEQDADLVMFMQRKPDEEDFNEQDVIIDVAKNRNGPTGKTTLAFNRQFQTWSEKERQGENRPPF